MSGIFCSFQNCVLINEQLQHQFVPCNTFPNAPIAPIAPLAPVPHVLPQETTTQQMFDERLGIHLENGIGNYQDENEFRFLVKLKIYRTGCRGSRTCLGFIISDQHGTMK